MKLIIGIALLIILIAAFYIRRSRPGHSSEEERTGQVNLVDNSDAYHAVSIQTGDHACKAARSIEGLRFLSREAPRIPLPGCDAIDCSCRFAHYDDRRDVQSRSDVSPSETRSALKESEQNPERHQ